MVLGASAFHYSKRHSVPLVVSYHAQLDKYLHYYGFGKLEPLFWKGTRSAYNVSDLALATSQAMVELLRQQGLKRVELWQKGVDTETFSPDKASPEMRERLTQGHPQDKLMVYIGRLSAEKEHRGLPSRAASDSGIASGADRRWPASRQAEGIFCRDADVLPRISARATILLPRMRQPTFSSWRREPRLWDWLCWKPWPRAARWWLPMQEAFPTSCATE